MSSAVSDRFPRWVNGAWRPLELRLAGEAIAATASFQEIEPLVLPMAGRETEPQRITREERMTEQAYAMIDGDGHVQEHDDEIREYLNEPARSGIKQVSNFPFFPTLDGYQRDFFRAVQGMHPGYVGAEEWLSFMDETGIESTVLYPTAGLSVGMIQDPDWAVLVSKAYNDWMYDRYQKRSPRMLGVALLPLQDVEESVKELTRCVEELGMVAAMLPANSADMGIRKPLGDRSFWPIYAEAQRLNVPLAVHGAPSIGLGTNFLERTEAVLLEHPLALMIQASSMLLSGMYDEFPRLKMAYLEADTGWVPYLIDRLTGRAKEGVTDPIDIMTSGRIYLSCQSGERSLRYAIERLSDEVILYASDYWHETPPEIVEDIEILRNRDDLSDDNKRNIFRNNTIRFYELDAALA